MIGRDVYGWLLLLVCAGLTSAPSGATAAAFSLAALVLTVATVNQLARVMAYPAPDFVALPRSRRLEATTPILRQYVPALAGRPQPRAPGHGTCAHSR